jgi:hypothetical protein
MKKLLLFSFLLFAFEAFSQTPYDTVNVYDPQNFVQMTTIDTANAQIISRKNNLNRRVGFQTLKDWILPRVTLSQAPTAFDTTGNAAQYRNQFITDTLGKSWYIDVDGRGQLVHDANQSTGGADGNGIYSAAGTVAAIPDMLVKLRPDTTFSIAHTNKAGFEDYWDTGTSGDYFQGFVSSPNYWGGTGMSLVKLDSSVWQEIFMYESNLNLLTTYGSGGNISLSRITMFSQGGDRGKIRLDGRRDGTEWVYFLPSSKPSTTLNDTTVMAWRGTGSAAEPIGFLPYGGGTGGSGDPDQTLSVSNDSLTISGTGNTVRVPGNGFLRDSVTTTTITVDLANHNNAVVVLKMESATNLTLTINNPWGFATGSYPNQTGESGVYTFHFRGVSGTDNITWPANFFDMGGTALGTDALTTGAAYTCYYDPLEDKYYCK